MSQGFNHPKNNNKNLQSPQAKKEEPHEPEDPTVEEDQLNYYNEYCRLYLANAVLSTQLK